MSSYGYEIALEQAVNEIAEINAQLEKLSHRKEMLEKLLGLLKQLAPQPNLVNAPASVFHAPVPEAQVGAAHEGPADDLPADGLTTEGATAFQISEPEVPANEFSPSAVSEFRELHEYVESETQPVVKASLVSRRPNSQELVAELAHSFWTERGGAHGHHEEDWFRAEQELCSSAA